jgi:hypothetical protein
MDFYISIIVGAIQAVVFNPIDKALYNSIITNTKLFTLKNWKHPFIGATNGIYTRIISGGIYFYLIDYTKSMNLYQSALTVSLTTSVILNPLNVIKFKSYIDNTSSYNSLIKTYKMYGVKFGKLGIESLIMRDFIFNCIYFKYKKENNNLIHNCSIICAASIISSPFHYIRNMKYYNDDSYFNICKTLFTDIKKTNNKLTFAIKQFAIGYGTIRTIAGVYTGQIMYSTLKEVIGNH